MLPASAGRALRAPPQAGPTTDGDVLPFVHGSFIHLGETAQALRAGGAARADPGSNLIHVEVRL
ncbi:hypothetical protein [Sorangium sp. So ce1335]|uniref:hypothetical protein n=1 Tax=Sorangium sp. So ce1335 TaxID=3133335 RepID=UPI003F61376C